MRRSVFALALASVLASVPGGAQGQTTTPLRPAGPPPRTPAGPNVGVARAAERAEALLSEGKRAEAIALLTPYRSNGTSAEHRRARLLLGQALIDSGKRDDADEPLKRVIEDYNDGTVEKDAEGLAQVGRAAHLLRSPKDANTAYKESERLDPKRLQTKLWWAELFLEKYDPGHAEELVKEALALDPKSAEALLLQARVKLDQTLDFEDAERLVKEALAIQPKLAGAYAVRAGLALRDMDLARADEAIKQGLALDPNHLELLSLGAATRFLDDDPKGFEAAKKTVLAKNPQYSRLYGIVGEYAEWEHRYDDIVTMMQEATRIDPDDAKAWAELGLTQMRSGDETNGLVAVKKAWSKDKFNVRVYNTLNLYEDQMPVAYETAPPAPSGVFKVRYAKDERAVLERYVPRMLAEAWGSMKARYGFVPKAPVQVEMYGSREHFSVRTSGLPNIGIQGVCFGGVVAAISPKAEPANWGNVLWHELAHVFHIQLSKNHVPRWFTEGLAEYETIARRPEWSRELDAELYQAIVQKKLPGAVDMNRAFTHANDASEITVAYYAASQMMVWTVERFGMPRVVQALELWGKGKKTPEVLQTAFGVSPAAYDEGFRAWALARMRRYDAQYVFALRANEIEPAEKRAKERALDPVAHVELALAYLRGKKLPEAKRALDVALKLDPKHPDAHFVAARLAISEKDRARAVAHLDAMRAGGHDGFSVRMLLADLAEAAEDKAAQRLHLESAYRLDPSQSEPLKALFDMAKADERQGDALDALRKIAPLEQHDRKVWRMLLERLVAEGAWDEALRVGEGAVYVDVMNADTHELFAKALDQKGLRERAAFERESAKAARGR